MIGQDYATGKRVDLGKPEEQVRQEYERVLVESYSYLKSDIDIEVVIPRGTGRFPDRADVVVYRDATGRDPARDIVGLVEVKKKTRRDGIAQLKSYMTATSAEWGVWTNGDDISYLGRRGTQVLEDHINNIPIRGQSVDDVGRLKKSELGPFARTELKSAFRRILNHLYANTNIGRREKLGAEMVKLIFAKIEDEKTYVDQPPQFRAETGEKSDAIRRRVNKLFLRVREELQHDGIFSPHEEISLDARSVAWVVGQLHNGSLLTTDTDVVGDAFEVFSESRFIGEKGEFFTPRCVVRVAVKIANPKPNDTICDPACGSGGFLIHAMKWVWEAMRNDPKWRNSPDFRSVQRDMSVRTVFGIDKETDLVKIAKAHMAIAGDGRSNIVHENSLHAADEFEGEAATNFVRNDEFRQFDLILTNPPFGTKTKVLAADAEQFYLGYKWSRAGGSWRQTITATDRDPYVLFVERCLEMVRTGGILGIVLPETVFHAPTLGYLRQFMTKNNNILAVVDLPHNTFRPHCNAKTCLLVLQKDEQQGDRVIMATPDEMGHDHNGRTLYRPGTGEEWDDLKIVFDELDHIGDANNRYVASVPWSDIDPEILVPRYYRAKQNPVVLQPDRIGIAVSDLIDDGTIKAWDGHGSPSSTEKGSGDIPYIRVSDIVNWELYRNPVSGVSQDVFDKFTRNKALPRAGDVIFVRRGSYRIGTVAMASPRDTNVVLTRELLTLRVNPDNPHGITAAYLLALMSSEIVQQQIPDYVFYDTTMPTIGDRWKNLVLPVHVSEGDIDHTSQQVDIAIKSKWEAQDMVDKLRNEIGGLTT